MKTIKIKDFTEYPGLRYCSLSDKSAQEYYHTILKNTFQGQLLKEEKLIIDLDGVSGYCPGFIDELFGNLVYDFSLETVEKNIIIKSDEDPYWKKTIDQTFLDWEYRRENNRKPKTTKKL